MSDDRDLDEEFEELTPGPRRRFSPLLATLLVMALFLVLVSVFTGIWTSKLWFSSIGYGGVFRTLISTRILLFAGFGLIMAVVVAVNILIAYRTRPFAPPSTPDQRSLERYREVVVPLRKVLFAGIVALLGIFAGVSAAGQWRVFLMWQHRQNFGSTDPFFHKDVGFYFFTLPWWHYVVDFMTTALVIGTLAAVLVHYVFGGIRLGGRERFTRSAQLQVCVMIGLLLLLKSVDYYLDRFDLTTAQGGLISGMTYARDHAVLPSKNILMFVALICALLFFANGFRSSWLLPGVGVALFAMSALLLGGIWPTVVQKLQVDPSIADKESPYIAKNIKATRSSYGLNDVTTDDKYPRDGVVSDQKLGQQDTLLAGIRLIDPLEVSAAFKQLQLTKGYYTVPDVLEVDHYNIGDRDRDLVVAARGLDLAGLAAGQQNWTNEHTVYTHGYGLIAAYGNQADKENQPQFNDGKPIFAEYDLPPNGELTNLPSNNGKGYVGQIYFGEGMKTYSIVGHPAGGKNVEVDYPAKTNVEARSTMFNADTGVKIGGLFNKLLYAIKFSDTNILLSSRVNKDSQILYDREPIERAQKVAPWLTFDSDALPSVVNGRIVWILDGYTTSDRYPLAEERSLTEMTTDALNPRQTYATLPTDHINYIRNAVKVTVDAYTGKVTLYQWDTKDPLLKAWEEVFPGVVRPKSSIPQDLLSHLRYPEDLYKVQRNIWAEYHVADPRTFFEGSDKWEVPQDPETAARKQPPYRLSVAPFGKGDPVYSLTSVYVPPNRQNLSAFMSVGANAADPATYGKITVLRLKDNAQVPGPSQIASQFQSDNAIAAQLFQFTRGGRTVRYGNLLTLPISGSLLYVQPVYTSRSTGAAQYPSLQFVLVAFDKKVGIGQNVEEALASILGGGTTTGNGGTSGNGNGGTGTLTGDAAKLLAQAQTHFERADAALKAGDPVKYAKEIEAARKLVDQAIAAQKKAPAKPTTTN